MIFYHIFDVLSTSQDIGWEEHLRYNVFSVEWVISCVCDLYGCLFLSFLKKETAWAINTRASRDVASGGKGSSRAMLATC